MDTAKISDLSHYSGPLDGSELLEGEKGSQSVNVTSAQIAQIAVAESAVEIQAAIDMLVGGAPQVLNKLGKIATALGNDSAFAATVSNALALKVNSADNVTALALKAPLASPDFTGTPSGPTAAPGTNTAQLSTTEFVQTAIAALVASSPAALDTLNELATALGNDPNFATTMVAALAGKVATTDLADPTAGAALVGFLQAVTGAVSRTVQDKLRERTSPLDVGAVGDGATIDSAALAKLADFNGVIDGLGKTYVTGAITFTGKVSLRNITFKPIPSFAGQVLVTIAGANSFLDIAVDADGKGLTCVDVTGNRVIGTVTAKNVTGVPQAVGGTQSGCRVSGQNCQILVAPQNFQKGTSDNDSIPRAATADLSGAGTGNNNIISVIGDNQIAGLVCSQPQVYVPIILIDGLLDNGIYHLGGNLDVGGATFKNALDETVVTEGTCRIHGLTIIDGHGSLGAQTGNLTIDDYLVISSNPARSYVPLRTRTGNVTSNVKIGILRGEIYLTDAANGAGIFQCAAGEVTDLTVDNIDLKVHYRAGSTKVLMNNDNGKKVSFGRMAIELIDDTGTLTNSDKFDFRIPPSLTQQSYIGPVNNVSASGEVRIVNAFQSLMQMAPGMEISVTAGPYILQRNAANPCPNRSISTGVPTVGTWPRGWIIEIKAPFISGVSEYTCTTGGSPGTWRASKWITGRGITASRPTLTANDTGVTYLDNTLNANGKPICWNGTAWVDATGAVV